MRHAVSSDAIPVSAGFVASPHRGKRGVFAIVLHALYFSHQLQAERTRRRYDHLIEKYRTLNQPIDDGPHSESLWSDSA